MNVAPIAVVIVFFVLLWIIPAGKRPLDRYEQTAEERRARDSLLGPDLPDEPPRRRRPADDDGYDQMEHRP
jgi:hypothetical protein